MMNSAQRIFCLLLFLVPGLTFAQEPGSVGEGGTFDDATKSIRMELDRAIKELNALRERVTKENLELSKPLADLETELIEVKAEFQEKKAQLDSRAYDLQKLSTSIKQRETEADYLSNLLGEYIREFESRIHISEMARYKESIKKAKDAPGNKNIPQGEIYTIQVGLLESSFARLEELLGGAEFKGEAIDPNSDDVKSGTFVLIGPTALFRSDDGEVVGTAEQRLGLLEPAVFEFSRPEDREAAANIVQTKSGQMPLDPTLGNAHKIAATEETLLEHIEKGGKVMYPILGMAGLALLIALYKWLAMVFIRKPSRRRINELLQFIEAGDDPTAQKLAHKMNGPLGKMLAVGTDNLQHPRELIEEAMYETVLRTRIKLQRMLPFIAICAASAPLMGLLGTVTGIINTFKMITVFGSGDVKSLSGGISEALITTKFGLIVAIPSLLLHAFLSRKARGVVGNMETEAVAFVNTVSRRPQPVTQKVPDDIDEVMAEKTDPTAVRTQVTAILSEMIGTGENGGGTNGGVQNGSSRGSGTVPVKGEMGSHA